MWYNKTTNKKRRYSSRTECNLLTYTKNYAEEQTTEVVEIRYINSKINQTKITYTTTPTTEYSVINTIENDLLPSMELSYFQSLEGVIIEQTENQTIITINQDIIDRNPSNQDLKENYFNDKLINLKIYFTNRYFECSESTP